MFADFTNDFYETVVFAGAIYSEIFVNDIKSFAVYLYIHTGITFWNSWL